MADRAREEALRAFVDLERGRGARPVLRRAHLAELDFTAVDLSGIDLQEADLTGTIFDSANLEGSDLRRAIAKGANFSRAVLRTAILDEARLEGADFVDANLRMASLQDADLRGASLDTARLERATLARANLSGSLLANASLYEANLARAELIGAQGIAFEARGPQRWSPEPHTSPSLNETIRFGLAEIPEFPGESPWRVYYRLLTPRLVDGLSAKNEGADLSRAELGGADLRGADLFAANLAESDLLGDTVSVGAGGILGDWTDLRGAGLAEANLAEAHFSWCCYGESPWPGRSSADFRGAFKIRQPRSILEVIQTGD